MSRRKKNNPLQVNKNIEEPMTKVSEEAVLETVNTELDVSRLELEKVKQEIEEKRLALKKLNSREYDEKEKEISDKQITRSHHDESLREKIERQKSFDNQKVTGKFINRRAPGQPVKLTYIKYADDPVKWYIFEDGKVYTIPRGFADQINDYYYTPKFIQKEGPRNAEDGTSQIAEVDNTNKKYAFMPVGFS